MYSTVILTFNEEANLPRCLASLTQCKDVVVLDSGSTDRTLEIARNEGVRVFTRTFDTFAGQRNWANNTIPFKNSWVLHLDADECMTPELHREVVAACVADDRSAYLVANRLIFMGKWIRRTSMYPTYQSRLIKVGEAQYREAGHGTTLDRADRGTGVLSQPYLHHNFSKGVADWLARHNRYSSDEARRLTTDDTSLWQAVLLWMNGATPEARRQGLKRCADFVPLRPLARFLHLYVFRFGFLDGRAGFDYAVLVSFYEFLIVLKTREIRRS